MKPEVVIIGLGYIGLPTSALIASRGTNVLGVDMEYDDPINCDLRINTDKISTDEVAKIILSKFKFSNN